MFGNRKKLNKDDYPAPEPDRIKILKKYSSRWKLKIRELGILDRSLTHSSFLNESGRKIGDNERMEYLGDSVLGLVVNEYLYLEYSDMPEGEMARIKSAVVSESYLYRVATSMDLGAVLRMGKGERTSGGATRPSNLSDALEALIAAVYLDQGMDAARNFILGFIAEEIDAARNKARDPKTELQEYIQKMTRTTPTYEVVSESGPEHSREFECRVLVQGVERARGTGSSRRRAEREAAARALEAFLSQDGRAGKIARGGKNKKPGGPPILPELAGRIKRGLEKGQQKGREVLQDIRDFEIKDKKDKSKREKQNGARKKKKKKK